jgi:hypothetical protein
MHSQTTEQSVRAGTFATLAAADRAVAKLLAAGFTPEEINVVCSDEAREAHFQQFRHQEPAGKEASSAVGAGVSIGAAVGGLTAIAVGAATGTVPLIIAGMTGLSAGSALGGFLGAMLTRGGEKELSNYYDQAVRQGRILVAVDVHGPQAEIRRAQAARLLADQGASPVPLPEG